VLDGGAPFYGVYRTSDGGHVALGAVEPQFFAEAIDRMGLAVDVSDQYDQAAWPRLRAKLEAAFSSRSLAEWREALEGTDACFAPVLSVDQAAAHKHNQARKTFIEVGGVRQPAPAPRFSRTASEPPQPPGEVGSDTDAVLAEIGLTATDIAALRTSGVVA